ncbi:MAG TPA: arylesterase, partial [Blastocatellia bacterium]|nr:arylesterase [Blastocatellia bacterium]
MAKKNRFMLLAGALLLATISVACQKSGAPNQATAGVANSGAALAPTKFSEKSEELPAIVAFGDSLTAGYGLPEDQTFKTLLQRRLDEK